MSIEENKKLIGEFIEDVFSQGNIDAIPNYFRPNTFWAGTIEKIITMQRTMMPDVEWTLDEMIAEGDKVVARLTFQGTFTGEGAMHPPTGNRVQMGCVWIFRMKENKIVSGDSVMNMLMLFEQLGVAPPIRYAQAEQ